MRKKLFKAFSIILMCALTLTLILSGCAQPHYVGIDEWQAYVVDRSVEADAVVMGLFDVLSSFGYNPIQLTEDEIDGILELLSSYNLAFTEETDRTMLYDANLYLRFKDALNGNEVELFRVHVIANTGKVIVVVDENMYISNGAIDYSEFEAFFKKEY